MRVTIENRGMAGDGTCTLYAETTGSNGDQSRAGPRIQLTDVVSGASVEHIFAWTGEPPSAASHFRGDCDPGLRS